MSNPITSDHRIVTAVRTPDGIVPDLSNTAKSLLLENDGVLAIHIQQFFTREECAALLSAVDKILLPTEPPEPIGEPKPHFKMYGPTQGFYRDHPHQYPRAVKSWADDPAFASVTAEDSRPVAAILDYFRTIFPCALNAAWQDGQKLWPSAIYQIDQAHLHVDNVGNHSPHWDIAKSQYQFGWNAYLQMPDTGGETVIYDCKPPAPEDMSSVARIIVRQHVGDLLVFNTHCIHEVREGAPSGKRITLNGMLGSVLKRLPWRELEKVMYWS